MLADMIERLFERHLDGAAQAAAREGQWLPALWAEVEEMGLPLALVVAVPGLPHGLQRPKQSWTRLSALSFLSACRFPARSK